MRRESTLRIGGGFVSRDFVVRAPGAAADFNHRCREEIYWSEVGGSLNPPPVELM